MELCIMRQTRMALCITLLAISGLSSVKSVETNNTQGVVFEFTMDITNYNYSTSLLNPSSMNYQVLYGAVKGVFYSIYGCFSCSMRVFYKGLSTLTFSNEQGSVLVKTTLKFSSDNITADDIKRLFLQVTAEGESVNGLTIDPRFTKVNPGPTSAPTHGSTTTRRKTAPTTTASTTRTIPTTSSTTTTARTTSTAKSTVTPKTTHITTTKTTSTVKSTITPNTTPKTTSNTTPTAPTTHLKTTPSTTRPHTSSTHPKTTSTKRPTTKHSEHSAASFSFYYSPITGTSFLRYSLSFILLILISCTF